MASDTFQDTTQANTFFKVFPLEAGDRLTRAEFERRYTAMPNVKKAELIEGKVYMPSPVRLKLHGQPSRHLSGWLYAYEEATPGVLGADDTTVRLDQDNEPQPDGVLFIDPNCGGQTQMSSDGFMEGAPELAVEVAASSASYDLGDKLQAYRRNGVCEYLVWRTLDREIDWFLLNEGSYESLPRDDRGRCKSQTFPGLWLDIPAMLSGDLTKVRAALQDGLASEEHKAFVARLQQQRKP